MEIIRDIDNLKLHNTIVTLGKFDGYHRGHRMLLDTAAKLKKDLNAAAVIFTFDVNPLTVINDDSCRTIISRNERSGAVYPDSIDYVVEFPFNKETMGMEPETFVKDILVDRLGVSVVVVGEDFRFGRGRSGSVETLKALGDKYAFTVKALNKLTYKSSDDGVEREISSSFIKDEILAGHMETVTDMLGKPFSVNSPVIHGKRLGRTIGFPTINQMVPEDKILPPDGVYATGTLIDGREYMSITNVGKRPTFKDGEHRTIETNIFDFDGDIYGRTLQVNFYKFIRPERRFLYSH
ncbi:MAG: riboflavin biosynthesis protein RibF [Parasporobacterium sp.]|nr:riboflavin biosynthesis protein RibF [Parasporobacterium sp.]